MRILKRFARINEQLYSTSKFSARQLQFPIIFARFLQAVFYLDIFMRDCSNLRDHKLWHPLSHNRTIFLVHLLLKIDCASITWNFDFGNLIGNVFVDITYVFMSSGYYVLLINQLSGIQRDISRVIFIFGCILLGNVISYKYQFQIILIFKCKWEYNSYIWTSKYGFIILQNDFKLKIRIASIQTSFRLCNIYKPACPNAKDAW